MCFSAEASFTSAGVLAIIGAITLREARKETSPQKLCYLAVIPLMFALQQFFEGIVWVTMPPEYDYFLLHKISVQGFLIFAGMFWPVWIPYTLYSLEEDPKRKKILCVTLSLGIIVAAASALSMIIFGNEAHIVAHNIAYPLPLNAQEHGLFPYSKIGYVIILGLYVLVTIGSSFISTVRYVWIFGVLTLIGFIGAQILYAKAFGSVWCFFAAIISIVCYFIVKKSQSQNP